MKHVPCLFLFALFLFAATAKEAPPRPNIVLIMVDDMGYSDIGCYGGEVKTPNLDALAANGLRFTQFYNCAKCAETRATLLTGNYNQAIGTKDMRHGATFAEVLRPAGYRTLIAGKWHQAPLPTTRGFDRYYGLADGCCNFFNPGVEAREGEGLPGRKRDSKRRWAIEGEAIMGYTNSDKSFYTTDAFTSYAIDRLDEYADENKPYLLYLPYTAPHYPLHAWPEDIAKYRGTYKKGWDKIRTERYARMLELGVIDAKTHPLSPRDKAVKAWDALSPDQQDAEDLKMAVYAAMIDRVDQNLGRLFAKIKEQGEWDNTLILFLTDNGACKEQPNTTPNVPAGPVESYRTISVGWANASNTPYRLYKSTDHEGGACTPFIAHWPSRIEPGQITDQVGHIIDITPTFMELAGATYPETNLAGGETRLPVGKSLLPIFDARQREPHEVLFWQFGSARAIREGDWKLVRHGKTPWELYNLAEDKTELNNLADKHETMAASMAKRWDAWYKKP